MEPDLRCYHHPEHEATGQCDRCGDYLCAQCQTAHDGKFVCPGCLADVTAGRIEVCGQIASVMNLVASLGGACYCGLPLVITGFVLALVGQRKSKPGAGRFYNAMIVYSGGQIASAMPFFMGFAAAAIADVRGGDPELWIGVLFILAAIVSVGTSIASLVIWARAARLDVGPKWAKVLILITSLLWGLGLLLIGGMVLLR